MIFLLASRLFQSLTCSVPTSVAGQIAIAISLLLGECLPAPVSPTPWVYRQPVLETIVKERQIIPQDAQGTFRLLPVSPHQLRLRGKKGSENILPRDTSLAVDYQKMFSTPFPVVRWLALR
jgi:hypothetical protein